MAAIHPCTYSKQFLPIFAGMLEKRGVKKVIDIFGGVGTLAKVKDFGYTGKVYINELEPKWAAIAESIADRVFRGDARHIGIKAGAVDAVITSPTYGNDMAVTWPSRERTYTVCNGAELQKGNTGAMTWGDDYKGIHSAAYAEAFRIIKEDGYFILNVKNHIRDGKEVQVAQWHKRELEARGFKFVSTKKVKCGGIYAGGLNIPRVPYEYIMTFKKEG